MERSLTENRMPKHYSHSDCFAHYGVVPRNPRWSWSGRSADGRAVAVTLWQDGFEDRGRLYCNSSHDRPDEWKSRPGLVELIENLAHARAHLDGLVHVILAQPKDPNANPRSISRCFPQDKLKMKVTELDESAGSFKLERVP
jgi:hypothetical protein